MSRPVDPIMLAEECMMIGFNFAILFYLSSLFTQAMGGMPVTPLENLIWLPGGFAIGFFGWPVYLKIHFWRQDKDE